ncbi:MAG: helix-turn-helix transcriptional regulator [Acutalibacteraceae bacterium]|nr:helix-turn-helix transcriptional regulator [Acutalibacteraceae bacterium]
MENTGLDMQTFAERLKTARNDKEMTQSELSTATGLSKAIISAYENPKSKQGANPSIANVLLLANVLEVSIDWLCGISNSKEPNKGDNISTKDFLYAVTEFVDNSEAVFFDERVLYDTDCRSIEFAIEAYCDIVLVNFIKDYQAVKSLKNTIPDTYKTVLNAVIDKYSENEIKDLFNGPDGLPF